MKKSVKQLFILCIILVLCVAILAVVMITKSATEKKQKAETAAAVVHIGNIQDASKIFKITYSNDKQTLSFVLNDDGEWSYIDDPTFPLDRSYLNGIALTTSGLCAVRAEKIEDNLEAYGFDEPSRTLKVEDTDGNVLELIVGKATGENYFAMIPGENTVYVIKSTLVEYLDKSLYDLAIYDRIPQVTGIDLDAITFISNSTNLLLTNDPANEQGEVSSWYVETADQQTLIEDYQQPNKQGNLTPTDHLSKVQTALEKIAVLLCVDYKPNDSQLATYGLNDQTGLVVKIDYTDYDAENNETPLSYELMIGNPVPTESGKPAFYYARVANSDMIITISAECAEPFLNLFSAFTDAPAE